MTYYKEWGKEATKKYIRNNQKRININYKIDFFANYIEPAIKKTGKPMATFIKEAIVEKIERENLLDDEKKEDLKNYLKNDEQKKEAQKREALRKESLKRKTEKDFFSDGEA